ncbi:MAG TPA: hypothetical protein VKM55_09065 [Candidatus Lokiarchaeia archaeon]|nr:hypothetical protein [Candidatus Lokiarchaeia archaeon]
MPALGITDNKDHVLWFSSSEISRYMILVKYATSFAQNIRDGRLEEIGHVPFLQNAQAVDQLENHVMFVKTKVFSEKKDELVIHFCLDYPESELKSRPLANQLLDLFIDKVLDKVKIKSKLIEKIDGQDDEFTSTCDNIFREVMTTHKLMEQVETGFLLDAPDAKVKSMILLFAAISVQGLPIAAEFYEDMTSHFRVNVTKSDNKSSILENLISAQLSTLGYESAVQGTSCMYLSLKFTDFMTFRERQLTVNFFPITDENRRIMQADDFTFIIMNEGDPELAHVFQMSMSPLISQTGLFNEKFSGNVMKYDAVKHILDQFPREYKSE